MYLVKIFNALGVVEQSAIAETRESARRFAQPYIGRYIIKIYHLKEVEVESYE